MTTTACPISLNHVLGAREVIRSHLHPTPIEISNQEYVKIPMIAVVD